MRPRGPNADTKALFDERLLGFKASRGGYARPSPLSPWCARLPVPSAAATIVAVSAAIALADFPALFLIDTGAAEALAIAYLSAFATIAATIAFAVLAELPLIVALIAKVRAAVAGVCFLNKGFHLGGAVRKAETDGCSRGNRSTGKDTRCSNN